MNKALMISIQPQHAVNILNGKKTLELRTWIPKDYVGWVYTYITKKNSRALLRNDLTYVENNELCFKKNYDYGYLSVANKVNKFDENPNLIGKVAFRFWFDEFIKLEWLDPSLNVKRNDVNYYNYYALFENVYNNIEWLLPKLCLTKQLVTDYGKTLYAWHIKKLEIFDEPKQLSEFYKRIDGLDKNGGFILGNLKDGEFVTIPELKNKYLLSKAPQKFCYCYVEDKENIK